MNIHPSIDIRELSLRIGLDETMVQELLGLFVSETLKHLDTLERSVDSSDAETFRLAAHTIKGSASFLGFHQLQTDASTLETLALGRHLVNVLPALARLREQCDELTEMVSALA